MRRTLGLTLALALTAGGCGGPILAKDGTLVIPQNGARGASVVTANGVEFHDRKDVPQRLIVRDPSEPWRPPIGFILPRNGRFVATSRPTIVATPGLAISLRPSDTRVPSWGGEVLVRIDVNAKGADGMARPPERIAIVVDGDGEDTAALTEVALGQLSGQDRVTIIDSAGLHVVVPTIPASHRSLAVGAVARRMSGPRGPAQLAAAIARASAAVGDASFTGARRIVLLSDGEGNRAYTPDVRAALTDVMKSGIDVAAVGSKADADSGGLSAIAAIGGGAFVADRELDARMAGVRRALPPAGLAVFGDVVLTFEGVPAPSHVLEASGGEVTWRLDAGELLLGDVRAGEARTEVVRVTVPAWVPGEAFSFTVTARANDAARGGERRTFVAHLPCVYDDDIERIANSRHGDVIAYASALATLSRLDAAFLGGGVEPVSELRHTAQLHARSMALLARDMRDPAMAEQAAVLEALLGASVP